MSTAPVTPESRHFSIPSPRPLWIGVAGVVMIAVALGAGVGLPIWRQRTAVRAVERAGGHVEMRMGGPGWLRRCVGDENMKMLDDVVDVRFNDSEVSDTTMDEVGALSGLKRLSTGNGTRVTDAGVEKLRNLKRLEYLFLGNPKVTDAGVKHLRGLTNLKDLRLPNTRLTDDGIPDLVRISKLEWLSLSNTHVTDEGLIRLRGLSGLKGLFIQNTEVTDRGLENLTAFTRLEERRLHGTRVTDEGVRNLQRALPGLRVIK